MNVGIGTEACAVSFLGLYKSDFRSSVQKTNGARIEKKETTTDGAGIEN